MPILLEFSFAKVPCGFAALLAVTALAACQTGDSADPNSTLTTQGNFQELASCYAQSQGSVAGRPVGSEGSRAVTVTSIKASPSAAGALSRSSSKSSEEAVESVGAASYRVTFRELPDNSTRVSGSSTGAATQPFVWFDTVVPALRKCTNNPDLR